MSARSASGQSAQRITDALSSWNENNPQEKLYVQTSLSDCIAGDPIYFKARCFLDGKPSYLSRIMYVDITNSTGKVIRKKMYPLDAFATAEGVIDTDLSMKPGLYTLNAYTLWMLNYPKFIFSKPIRISGGITSSVQTAQSDAVYVDLFPEGGALLATLKNTVAFKAYDEKGLPAEVNGNIVSDDGHIVTSLKTAHAGLGKFDLTPLPNTTYTINIETKDGRKFSTALPHAQNEGVLLHTENAANKIFVVLDRADVNPNLHNKFILVAQINSIPVYKAEFNFSEGRTATAISKKGLPPGVMQITIFDSIGNVIRERLTFCDTYSKSSPSFTVDPRASASNAAVDILIKLDSPGVADVSVTGIKGKSAGLDKNSLLSYSLLSSEFSEHVYEPSHYFADKSTDALTALDIFLMTRKWQRFNWADVIQRRMPILKYPVESALTISGKAAFAANGKPAANSRISLMIKADDSTTIMTEAFLNKDGEFLVDSLSFQNRATIYVPKVDKQGQRLDVTVNPGYTDTLQYSFYKNFSESIIAEALAKGRTQVATPIDTNGTGLQAVVVRTRKLTPEDSLTNAYVSPVFANSDQTLQIPQSRVFTNIWQFLNQNIPGFNVNPYQPGGVTSAMFERYGGTLGEEGSGEKIIKFLLNEINVSADVIDNVSPEDVALVKVYKGALGFPFGADAGVISVYTKKPSMENTVSDRHYILSRTGYATSRKFIYQDPKNATGITQEKNIVVWQPTVRTDSNKPFFVRLPKTSGSYSTLIVEGIDKNGDFIELKQTIQMK